ncbi:uncharacterized protein B0J16DRAFT_323160 [Fusarium flagelliforme]|uniref:uncharacterized protein n=1 Tax=Fusarium flagelliforme TaxID=2675880 RepID=UPI001E8CCED4|nr:uncharacterized protein B0J16DRAFT_323160 [Fusarium flagelliforme]KAH7179681.1 hypothetical protein B0J16DRAFT_323160 [Fusarium flagelliforme]
MKQLAQQRGLYAVTQRPFSKLKTRQFRPYTVSSTHADKSMQTEHAQLQSFQELWSAVDMFDARLWTMGCNVPWMLGMVIAQCTDTVHSSTFADFQNARIRGPNGTSNTLCFVTITGANTTTVVTQRMSESFVGLTLATTNTVWPSLQALTWRTPDGSASVIVNAKGLNVHAFATPAMMGNLRRSVAHITVKSLIAKMAVTGDCSALYTLVLNQVA